MCKTLIEQGVDILELGVPFSDPLADGLTNQLAANGHWKQVVPRRMFFNLFVKFVSFRNPIVFYTYYNLIFSQGVEEYAKKSKDAGVDGLLTLDLPPEEADELIEACKSLTLPIFLLSLPQLRKKGSPKLQRMRPDFSIMSLAKV